MTVRKDDGAGVMVSRPLAIKWRGDVVRIDLITVDDKGHELDAEAAHAWRRMVFAASLDGIDLRINTAFRSRQYQQSLRDAYDRWETYQRDLRAWEDGGRVGNGPTKVPHAALAAKPGYSLHEIGRAVDVLRAEGDDPKTARPDSPVDLWLEAHAAEYGFYRDVPGESWHFSYHGRR